MYFHLSHSIRFSATATVADTLPDSYLRSRAPHNHPGNIDRTASFRGFNFNTFFTPFLNSSHISAAIYLGGPKTLVTATIGPTFSNLLQFTNRILVFISHTCFLLSPPLHNFSIYVDIIDFIDCVIDTNGLLASCSVHGDILCNSKLSGRAPEVLLSFSNISIIDDMSLHPCVKYNR